MLPRKGRTKTWSYFLIVQSLLFFYFLTVQDLLSFPNKDLVVFSHYTLLELELPRLPAPDLALFSHSPESIVFFTNKDGRIFLQSKVYCPFLTKTWSYFLKDF